MKSPLSRTYGKGVKEMRLGSPSVIDRFCHQHLLHGFCGRCHDEVEASKFDRKNATIDFPQACKENM